MALNAVGLLALVLCLGLLAGAFLVVDPVAVVDALGRVPLGAVLAGLALVQVQIVLSALRWRFTAGRLGHAMSLPRAIGEYYVGATLNQILPGGVAGDAVRAYRGRTGDPGGWKRPASAVVLERLSGQLAFFLLAGLGFVAWPVFLGDRLPDGFATLLAAFLLVLVAGLGLGVTIWKSRFLLRFDRLKPDLLAVFWQNGAVVVQAGLSLAIVASYVATFLIASAAVGAPLPAIAAVTAIPLCLLVMLIPAGIGGWGTREVAAAALWPLFGHAGAEGLSASLLYGMLSLAGAALPGVPVILAALVRGRVGRA